MARTSRQTFMLVALGVALTTWHSPTRGQPARVLVPDSVRAAAARGESAHVIVGVRVDGYQPEGNLSAAEATRQRATMRAASQRVLDRLPSAARARTRAFDFIPYFSSVIDANALLQLEGDPDVTSVEEDQLFRPMLVESVPLIGGTNAWAAGFSGRGWTVAILDTGTEESHPFLAGKTVSEACYSNAGVTDPRYSLCPSGLGATTGPGAGLNCNPASVSSSCYHGTHVAGIAAGSGSPFSGVAKDATIIPIQVFTNFGGSLSAYKSDVLAGLNRVYELSGIFNIASANMSLGGWEWSNQASCDAGNLSFKAGIDLLRSVNIASVIASGNSYSGNSISEPACISTAVSVGSTTKTDVVSTFSNSASFLSLLAPGESIYSSAPGTFRFASGTSMATPHVAGTWAVIKQAWPAATVTDVLNDLRATGKAIPDARNGMIFPRIHVDAALSPFLSSLQIEGPSSGSALSVPFGLWGWAIDRSDASGTGISTVHVWAFPSNGAAPIYLGPAVYGTSRSDIGAIYGSRFTNSGYELMVTGALTPGSYTLKAYGLSRVTGIFSAVNSLPITILTLPSRPGITLDRPQNSASSGRKLTVSGWAVDLGSERGTGVDIVHVWAFPAGGGLGTFLGTATYGLARLDVGAALGDSRFALSGFQLTSVIAPGNYTIRVYMRSTVTATFNASAEATNVSVSAGEPQGNIESPLTSTSVTRPFGLWGWAADTAASAGTGVDAVHVWAFPIGGAAPVFVGAAMYGQSRPDVGAVLGNSQFNDSGYSLLITLENLPAPGIYDVFVYARSTVTGDFTPRTVRVTVN